MFVSSRRDSDPIPHGTQRSKRWAKLCRPTGTRSSSAATPDLRPGLTYSAPYGAGFSHNVSLARLFGALLLAAISLPVQNLTVAEKCHFLIASLTVAWSHASR